MTWLQRLSLTGGVAALMLTACLKQLVGGGGGAPTDLARITHAIRLMDCLLPVMLAENTGFVYSTIAEQPSTESTKQFRVMFGGSNLHMAGWLDVGLCYSSSGFLSHAVVSTATFASAGAWAQGAVISGSVVLAMVPAAPPKRTVRHASKGLELTSASAKFDYKSANSNEAEQTGAVSGKAPTSYDNFFQVSSFRLQANQGPGSEGIDHSFSDSTGAQGKDGTKYRKKFFWWDVWKTNAEVIAAAKSGGGEKPWAIFTAQIKDGEMKFNYIMKKASEGDKVVGLGAYDQVHDTMSSNKPIKAYSNAESTFTAGFESQSSVEKMQMSAGKTKGTGKLAK